MRFKIKDNYGKIHFTKNYEWEKESGIPNEETLLEEMEECTCSLNEENAYCDGSCCIFDEGEVIAVVQ